jgi:hypothetical protein
VDVGSGGGGSRFAWVERERERELGRGRKWKRGGGRARRGVQKGRGGSVVAGERADVGTSTAGRSWARGSGRADKWGRWGREREGAGARESNGADRPVPRSSERARERGLGIAPTDGVRLSCTGTRGCRRARGLGLMGCLRPNWLFLFS